jgi:hypothetical protein
MATPKEIVDELHSLPTVEKLYAAAGLLKKGGDVRIVVHLIQLVELELRLHRSTKGSEEA